MQSDSQLIVGNEEYEIRDLRMAKYVCLVKLRLERFAVWKLEHIPKGSNENANALAVVAASLPTKEAVLLPVYYQPESSITASRVNDIEDTCPSWMTPIACYLSSRELLDDRVETHKIRVQAAQFSLVNGQLYKCSLSDPYLKCLTT